MNASQPGRCLPYGADPDSLATKRHRPPCLDCPEFKLRERKARLKTRESYALPPTCRDCRARLDYADATDPSRQRYVPEGRQAQRLEEGIVSGYRVSQGPRLYALLDKRAAAFGWPKGIGQALVDLKGKEGCSYRVMGKLFGISPQLASRLHKQHLGKKGGK